MNRLTLLPSVLLNRIALFTGDYRAVMTLAQHNIVDRDFIMKHIQTRTLLYGPVQSGKTNAILEIIQRPENQEITKVLVIQNSRLVLSQYRNRMKAQGILFQVINKKTEHFQPGTVLLVMNNKYRLAYYQKVTPPEKFLVIMDEADLYGRHPIADGAREEFYVTATPFCKIYRKDFFHHIHRIPTVEQYVGMSDVDVRTSTLPQAMFQFLRTETEGMMLVNSISRVQKMKVYAAHLSAQHPNLPVIVLTAKKWLYYQGKVAHITEKNISSIIDIFVNHPHIVFVANRLSLRGLSYTSTDYSRNLTHQFSDFSTTTITNSLQKMRLLGKKGEGGAKLILYLQEGELEGQGGEGVEGREERNRARMERKKKTLIKASSADTIQRNIATNEGFDMTQDSIDLFYH